VRLLNFDDRILITDEFGTFHDFNSERRYQKLLDWPRLKNPDARAYQRLVEKNIDPRIFLERLTKERPIGRDIFKILEDMAVGEFSVIGDKAPLTYLAKTNILINTIPNFKIIFTMRDGRDVISSQIRNYKGVGKSADWAQPTIEQAQSFRYNWVGSAKLIDKYLDLYPNHTTLVKYEDLLNDLENGIYKIQEFLGLEISTLDDGGWYKPVHRGVWEQEHSEMMTKLSDEFKKWLERFEYI
jgi:hypothetical protein